MTKIIGVDYSGAKGDRDTWITGGQPTGSELTIDSCRYIKRQDLTELLKHQPEDTIAVMDFPFGMPQGFAKVLAKDAGKDPASQMPDLWSITAEMDYGRFEALRNSFVECRGEMIRRGDAHFGGPFSPLHTTNPSMLQMTFHGMQMLHQLWQAGCSVPPLPACGRKGATLLETMPGVLLRAFSLPAESYKNKNKTNAGCPQRVRRRILDGLKSESCASGIALVIPGAIEERCIKNHNALDSLVAAIGAAMWVKDKSQFLVPRERIPQNEEIQAARLEGWIYAPMPKV